MKTRLDSKVFQILGHLVDIIWISLLWYISSILLITMGASSAAMYQTVHLRIFKGEGYLLNTYGKAFLQNLKKGTVTWIVFLLLDAFLVFDLSLARMAIDQGSALAVFYYPLIVCIVLALIWQLSACAYQARFEDTVKAVFVKSAFIAAGNMGWMLFLVIILFGAVFLCRYLIFITVLLPGGYACLMHHVFEHIYTKTGWIEKEEQ